MDAPAGTHRTIRQASRKTDISRTSVHQIIDEDLPLDPLFLPYASLVALM